VDRRTKCYSQVSHLGRPHQISHLYANTRVGCLRNNSRTLIKTRLCVVPVPGVFCCVCVCVWGGGSVLLTSPSLFSYPYSYPPHFPSFSCATIHCSPSQILFLPLLMYSIPIFTSLFYAPSTCHHTVPPSHLLTRLLYQLYTTSAPCNP
jgi:hypothetical protein